MRNTAQLRNNFDTIQCTRVASARNHAADSVFHDICRLVDSASPNGLYNYVIELRTRYTIILVCIHEGHILEGITVDA